MLKRKNDANLEMYEFQHSSKSPEIVSANDLTTGLDVVGTAPKRRSSSKPPAVVSSTSVSSIESAKYDRPLPAAIVPRQTKRPAAARASKACEICRRQKTRCFPALNSRSCLRCLTLGFDCSFLDEGENFSVGAKSDFNGNTCGANDLRSLVDNVSRSIERDSTELQSSETAPSKNGFDTTTTDYTTSRRLSKLEDNVSQILEILKGKKPVSASSSQNPNNKFNMAHDVSLMGSPLSANTNKDETLNVPSFGRAAYSYMTSPFYSLGSVTPLYKMPLPISRLFNPQMVLHDQDIISMGILPLETAIELISSFRKGYGRWVSFPENVSTEVILDRTRSRCSLLLTVCVCVSMRYSKPWWRTKTYKLCLQKLEAELNLSLLIVPQTIEFMQALAVLAIYGLSLSEGNFVIDSWFYSSLALQHFVTKDTLGLVMSFDGIGPVTEFDEITAYRVWNHLCLVHLVNCVLSGRMCILDEIRLDQCCRTLELGSATNFDGRIVAEVSLQLIVYNFIETSQSLQDVEEGLKVWIDQWGYLFEQPTTQFTETSYHYGYFLVLFHWCYRVQMKQGLLGHGVDVPFHGFAQEIHGLRSFTSNAHDVSNSEMTIIDRTFNNIDEEMMKRLIRHCLKIMDGLLIVDDDDYFKHLSDQVHFYGVFAAVMLCRILLISLSRNQAFSSSTNLFPISLQKIHQLASRFKIVGTCEEDLVLKYSEVIFQHAQCIDLPLSVV
ncbi:hypothetical protein NADFUDRAFT_49477 [Nadsonia fulvescens var. elongata DSM 6958]|uniref:Zn(2)-C6 fungal-type domain-containing protein n=1 Tax=Nadsonia fulvescens var. elongata DSM 6958 TaxID=857566 RepID=A0A1E3PQB6_9ASCO|nr:hypothetical protein NADFUDRAFT_49477 [Nadsonia fulvescens var. elongata DSM 6958]